MSRQIKSKKPILKRSTSFILHNCKSIEARITNHWSRLRTKEVILPCPLKTCSSTICSQTKTYSKPPKGGERWAWPRATLNNPEKKIGKKNTKPKGDILKHKYWYEEPKPLKFYNKYSMGAKTFFLGLADAPRS